VAIGVKSSGVGEGVSWRLKKGRRWAKGNWLEQKRDFGEETIPHVWGREE